MDWAILLPKIIEVVLIPLFGYLTAYLIKYFKAKSASLGAEIEDTTLQKYLALLTDTVVTCVETTNQTYVDTLKKAGSFDKEAQKEAFKQTYEAVLSILTEDAKIYLTEAVGDFELFLTNKIEAAVKESKK